MELAAVDSAVASALAGRGTLLLFTGEPGIGKSRLLRELEAVASRAGCVCAWGRAWEVGGAPAFWPWLQICRSLGVAWDDPATDGGRDARFARFDRLAEALAGLTRQTPVALLFDDLHAADEASLQLLTFVSRRLAGERAVIAAAARDAEIVDQGLFGVLARDAECLAPKRLSRAQVAVWIGDDEQARTVFDASEGLPLFVDELLRVGVSGLGRAQRLRAVLDAHVARLPPDALSVVERASVVGRRFALDEVALDASTRVEAALCLGAATAAGVLVVEAESRYSFAHVLLRDRLYERIEAPRREALHAELGWWLAERGELAQALHHLVRANLRVERERVAQVGLGAARNQFDDLAFEQAAALCDTSLEFVSAPSKLGFELTLLGARARFASGAVSDARDAAARAHELACALGDADAAAVAALTYGTEVFSAEVDPRCVRLLETALALGPAPGLDARARARLAAARVPPSSSEEAMRVVALAHDAVDRARALGDATVLLETLRHTAPAVGYMVPEADRLALTDEIFDIARALDRHDVVAEVAGIAFTFRTLAGRTDAAVTLTALERAVAHLGRHQIWRLAAARASLALFAGQFDEARAQADVIDEVVTRFEVSSARVALISLRIAIAELSGAPASIADHYDPADLIRPPGTLFRSWVLAALGRHDEARAVVRTIVGGSNGFPQLALAGEVCAMLGDRELAAQVRAPLAEYVDRTDYFAGPGGIPFIGPTSLVVADLDRLLGDEELALAGYRRALERCELAGFLPKARAVKARLDRSRARSSASPEVADAFALGRAGELWRLTSNGRLVGHLPDVKGMAYLELLLANPERDFHVLELIGAEHVAGDAGPALDDQAVVQYRVRLRELRTELDDFEAAADVGRAERTRTEIEHLEDQLGHAFGLGQRVRVAGSELERARINVQRRLKDALDRVAKLDADMGKRLRRAVRTGTTCSYRP